MKVVSLFKSSRFGVISAIILFTAPMDFPWGFPYENKPNPFCLKNLFNFSLIINTIV